MTERWELAEAMSILRSRVGVAVLNNKLYAFGGYNGIERLSSVEVFDPSTKSWNIVSPMHRKRRSVILIDNTFFNELKQAFDFLKYIYAQYNYNLSTVLTFIKILLKN